MSQLKLNVNTPESEGFSRREFGKLLLGTSALSILTLSQLNAAVYQSITSLNEKHIKDEAPDGVYWDEIGKHYLFKEGIIMMNNGTVGPMPKPVYNTLIKTFKVQATNPFDFYKKSGDRFQSKPIKSYLTKIFINGNHLKVMNIQ